MTCFKEYPDLEYSISKNAAFVLFAPCSVVVLARLKQTMPGLKKVFEPGTSLKVLALKLKGSCQNISPPKPIKSAHLSYAHFAKICGHVDVLLDKAKRVALIQEDDHQQNRRVIEILLDITRTLGRQGIAFRGHGNDDDGNFKQIVKLMAKYCPELRHWINMTRLRPYHVTHLSAQSQTKFIKLIGHKVQQRIIQDVKDAGMYSVMANTTPDVSHKDRLPIACRYVDKMGQRTERLLSFSDAKDKTGEGGATEIIGSLMKQGLKLDQLCFQSYDYTASKSGRFNGVQKKLQDKLERSFPYIPCLAHRSNTVIEHSCKASPIISELFNVLERLFVFYTDSTKHMSSLQDSIKALEVENPLNLRNLSKMRWTARAESIKSVWSSYEAILDSLERLEESGVANASGLRSKLLHFDFIVSIMFMKNVMYKTK